MTEVSGLTSTLAPGGEAPPKKKPRLAGLLCVLRAIAQAIFLGFEVVAATTLELASEAAAKLSLVLAVNCWRPLVNISDRAFPPAQSAQAIGG